jgi:hypothetical protein
MFAYPVPSWKQGKSQPALLEPEVQTVIVQVDSEGRLPVPVELLPVLPGQRFAAFFDADEDALVLRRLSESDDWVEVLTECPVPMTDIPPRSRELPKRRSL